MLISLIAQVHLLEDGTVKVFSRSSLDDTEKFPEVVKSFNECIHPGVTSCIIDSECVAYDVANKNILPFQTLSGRSKKGADADSNSVKVCLFAFDLLYLNGQSLIKETLRVRRQKLQETCKHAEGMLHYANASDGSTAEEIQEFLDKSIEGNCEGLMVKTLDGAESTCEPPNNPY